MVSDQVLLLLLLVCGTKGTDEKPARKGVLKTPALATVAACTPAPLGSQGRQKMNLKGQAQAAHSASAGLGEPKGNFAGFEAKS